VIQISEKHRSCILQNIIKGCNSCQRCGSLFRS